MTTNENQNHHLNQNPVDPNLAAEPAGSGDATQPSTPAKTRTQKNAPWLIGAGAAAAVLLLGGGGIAIGAALADNDRDDASVSNTAHSASEDREDGEDLASPSNDAADDVADDRGGDSGSASGSAPGAGLAKSDAASLTDAIDAAIAKASGDGVTSIEVERGGWSVDVALADGTEVEVYVAEGGSSTVRENDAERSSEPLIETSKLSSLIDASVAAAGGGSVESISTDNDLARYEVSVDLGNGQDVDVEFDEKLEVIGVD